VLEEEGALEDGDGTLEAEEMLEEELEEELEELEEEDRDSDSDELAVRVAKSDAEGFVELEGVAVLEGE
jgi:hypothetical protein